MFASKGRLLVAPEGSSIKKRRGRPKSMLHIDYLNINFESPDRSEPKIFDTTSQTEYRKSVSCS